VQELGSLFWCQGHRRGTGRPPPALKIFRASANCPKILNDKRISIQWNFSGQAQIAQKSWIIKNSYSVQWIQGKRKLLKNPECKKYIQYSEKFRGNSVFFQGKRKLLKNRQLWKNLNTVIRLGAIRVIWASVVCDQDQRRDWL